MLHNEHIKSGDLLLIEEGKLPPKVMQVYKSLCDEAALKMNRA